MPIHHCMINIKYSSKHMHPCILLAYCITSHGVYQAFIKTCASLYIVCIRVTSHLSMHHNSCIAQICITLVVLIFASSHVLYMLHHLYASLHSHWVFTPVYPSSGFLKPPNIQGSLSHFIT